MVSYKDKKKQLEYQKNWMRERRRNFFKDKFCEKCNSIEKLELHHKDPKKKESHNIWSWSEKRRNEELKKCVVWCRECHIKYHANLKRKEIEHGTKAGYSGRGCRCVLCTEAAKLYQREWIKKRR